MKISDEKAFAKVNVFGNEVPGENTANEWCEPVTDEAYNQLKAKN